MFRGTESKHSTEECDRVQELVAGGKRASSAEPQGGRNQNNKRQGNGNRYGKKGNFAHQNSRADGSVKVSADSAKATYQQDEDGNFVLVSANSAMGSIVDKPTFDPRYIPVIVHGH